MTSTLPLVQFESQNAALNLAALASLFMFITKA
jgi:hypothetical protein